MSSLLADLELLLAANLSQSVRDLLCNQFSLPLLLYEAALRALVSLSGRYARVLVTEEGIVAVVHTIVGLGTGRVEEFASSSHTLLFFCLLELLLLLFQSCVDRRCKSQDLLSYEVHARFLNDVVD